MSEIINRLHELYIKVSWIPVEKRLPEHMQLVIATNGKCVTEASYYAYAGRFCKHGWYQIDGMSLGAGWATHWMPSGDLLTPEEPE